MFGRQDDRLAGGSSNAEHALATRGPLVRDRVGFPFMGPVIVGDDAIAYLDIGNRLLAAIGQEYQGRTRQALANAAWMAFYAGGLCFVGTEARNPLPVFLLIAGEWPGERVGEIVPEPFLYRESVAVALRLSFAGLCGSGGNGYL